MELKGWKKGKQEHSEHDSMGQDPIVSNRTIRASLKQKGFFFFFFLLYMRWLTILLEQLKEQVVECSFQEHLQNHTAFLVIKGSQHHWCKKLQSGSWGVGTSELHSFYNDLLQSVPHSLTPFPLNSLSNSSHT